MTLLQSLHHLHSQELCYKKDSTADLFTLINTFHTVPERQEAIVASLRRFTQDTASALPGFVAASDHACSRFRRQPEMDGQHATGMQADRLIAYSDGVIAIIVTIMVLELHAPSTPDIALLLHLWPTFGAYALGFLLVSIYWVNHHHLLFANRQVDRDVLWLNIHFLFWLSLFPFATAYISGTRGASIAVAVYASLVVATAAAFRFLGVALSRRNAHVAVVRQVAPGRRRRNTLALVANLAAFPAAFVSTPLAFVLLSIPAALYFLPDARVEQYA